MARNSSEAIRAAGLRRRYRSDLAPGPLHHRQPAVSGGNRVRQELGDEYVDALFRSYAGRVPRFADLCCSFFEQAREQIDADKAKRVGLLATISIRGGVNREVLKRIKQTGDIFRAWFDKPSILNGAAVRIAIVGFDNGDEGSMYLNDQPVPEIRAVLTMVAS